MGTNDDWQDVVSRIQAAGGDPSRSPYAKRLYALAVEDGARFLRSFRARLGDDGIRDLIHDLLSERFREILNAETPRALYCVALKRRAISWHRDQKRRQKFEEEQPPSARQGTSGGEDDRTFFMDAREALSGLSARDRDIVIAVALGESRETIAEELQTTRANVDQIVSRLRRAFREEE